MKSAEEAMQILEAFDLTGSYRDAAELTGCSHHTVACYVAEGDGTRAPAPPSLERIADPFFDKIEEWVDQSKGKIHADVCQRTTRRAVAQAKASWRAGHRRVHRP